MREKSDEELIWEIQAGNILAFEIIVRRYQTKLLQFANRIVKNEPLAQEIVQDALFSVYKTIERVDAKRRFSHYIFVVTRNFAMSALRRLKPQVSLANFEPIEEDKAYEMVFAQEKRKEVRNVIAKLAPNYKNVVRLYYFEELSYKEIGKRLGLPINTVRTHLRRAKTLLRDQLTYETA